MRKGSELLFLVVSLLHWAQTAGDCDGAIVSMSGYESELRAGEGFDISCEFMCLRPQQVVQLWRENGDQDKVSLVNITPTQSNVILVLRISSATTADTGYYSCRTQPPDTIGYHVLIQVVDNLTTSTQATPSTPQCNSTQQHISAAGVQGQLWYWILLGKSAILFLSLAALAGKCTS